MVGRKILNGDFNLTRISFPIKCMMPQTTLMSLNNTFNTMPVYIRRAASTADPIERLKLVMASNFSQSWYSHEFGKPLNPILGETYECFTQDGTKCFFEQTSHHPPRSHFLLEAKDGLFKLNGYLEIEIYAGMQTTVVNCLGFKQLDL